MLNYCRFGYYFNYQKKSYLLLKAKSSMSLKKLKKFFLIYNQFFKNLNANVSLKSLSRNHKIEFKKLKKFFYLQTYVLYIERFAASILYKSRLIPKLKYMKQFILHNNLYVNNRLINNPSYKFRSLDFIHIHISCLLKPTQPFFDKHTKKFIVYLKKRLIYFFKYKKIFYMLKIKKKYLINKNFLYIKSQLTYF